jgi:hydroxymethylglutaryl-CoA synthase
VFVRFIVIVVNQEDNDFATKMSETKNVGIMAIEIYTPSTFVLQSKLEEHYGVAQGKYTIGLGQEGLGICGDVEDINSLALTVVNSLLEK